jgi:sulfatase modifying factor 1
VKARTLAFLFAVLCAVSCSNGAPVRAQWVVYLTTDAPVPQFGQQVAVEVLDGSGTSAAEFLDASNPSEWPISFGLVPSDPTSSVRLHIRFYRLSTTATGMGGLPGSTSYIDATATLPPADGLSRVALPLTMSCFGVMAQVSSAMTCNPATGSLGPEPVLVPGQGISDAPTPGSWPPAAEVACSGTPPAGMVCVPGGAFIMGSSVFPPRVTTFAISLPDALFDPTPERLVQVAPFALDTDEVTVGSIRTLVAQKGLSPPVVAAANPDDLVAGLCTYLGANVASNDALPANCVTWTQANEACSLMGKRLPTEAEWESVARNLTAETPYPWGTDPNACSYAIVAHGLYFEPQPVNCELKSNGFSIGPQPGGDANDKTQLGVLNLGGNVSEWLEDYFGPYGASITDGGAICWGGGLLVDPLCSIDTSGQGFRSFRGGNYASLPNGALSYIRNALTEPSYDATLGFRCAVSM